MKVLVVDNNIQDLEILCSSIKTIHPDYEIVSFIDPLMAFKYSIANEVNVLYTAVNLKRLPGFKLEKLMREDHPGLIVNFIADGEDYREKAIQHLANSYTVKPISAEKLRAAESEE